MWAIRISKEREIERMHVMYACTRCRHIEMFDKLVSLNSWLYDDKMKFKQDT